MTDFLQFFGLVALWGTLSVLATIILGTAFAFWWMWLLKKVLKVTQ